MEDPRAWACRLHRREQLGGGRGHVLELEGDDVDGVGEARQGLTILIGRDRCGCGDLEGGRSCLGAVAMDGIAEAGGGHGRHAAKLTGAQYADGGTRRDDLALLRRFVALGSSATLSVRAWRQASSALATRLSERARTAAARRAAFTAPASPMASVPTGMPAGI